MVISTNPKPTIYRNLYDNTCPGLDRGVQKVIRQMGTERWICIDTIGLFHRKYKKNIRIITQIMDDTHVVRGRQNTKRKRKKSSATKTTAHRVS